MSKLIAKSIALILLLCSAAAACPLCRDSIAISSGNPDGGTPPVELFNSSILVILFTLLIVVIVLIVKLVVAIRVANRIAVPHAGVMGPG